MKTTVDVPEQSDEDKGSRILKGMTITLEAEPGDGPSTLLFIAHARINQLEQAIRDLVIDICDKDGPAYRQCSGCSALDAPYSFKHDDICPVKPALDLVFGPNDADHTGR